MNQTDFLVYVFPANEFATTCVLLTTGTVAVITRITNIGVHRDIVWID